MDHIGKKARVESAFLVQDKMKELGKGKDLPAILTGDFNVDQTHQSYDAFVSKGVLCVLTDTYRSIVGNGEKKQANDCPEEIDIKAYQARTPSDHFPVKVELEFDERQQK